jgi:hypothetical protein
MKLATFVAAALAVASTSALAEEAVSNNGFSLGGEVASEYKVDAEQFTVVLTPEATYTMGDTALIASTDLSVWDSVADDNFTLMNSLDEGSYPKLGLEVTHQLQGNMELSLGTTWDFNEEAREEITVGATFKF